MDIRISYAAYDFYLFKEVQVWILCNYITDYFSAIFHNDQENTFDQKCLIEIEMPQQMTRIKGPRSLANGGVKHLINLKSQMQKSSLESFQSNFLIPYRISNETK